MTDLTSGSNALAIVPTPQQRISSLLIANNDLQTVTTLASLAYRSGLAKVSDETQAAFIILKGLELGIQPFTALEGIFATEHTDRNTGKKDVALGLTVSLMMALVESSGKLEDIQLPDPSTIVDSATVTVKRVGRSPFTFTFTRKMAESQNLLGKFNWRSMFPLMMMNRAISGALRPIFPDVLKGMYLLEEIAPNVQMDDSGTPIEIVEPELVEDDKPANITSLAQPTPTNITPLPQEQPEEEAIEEDPLPEWVTIKNVDYVIESLLKNGMGKADITRLIMGHHIHDLDAWGKWDSGKDAAAAVLAAWEKEQAAAPPAQPRGKDGAVPVDFAALVAWALEQKKYENRMHVVNTLNKMGIAEDAAIEVKWAALKQHLVDKEREAVEKTKVAIKGTGKQKRIPIPEEDRGRALTQDEQVAHEQLASEGKVYPGMPYADALVLIEERAEANMAKKVQQTMSGAAKTHQVDGDGAVNYVDQPAPVPMLPDETDTEFGADRPF